MHVRKTLCVCSILVVTSSWILASQQSEQPSPGASASRAMAFLAAAAAYTKEVRLDAASIEAVLGNIDSLNSLKDDATGEDLAERTFSGGRYDFSVVTSDPDYVSWCRSRGLDPEGFFRNLTRLEMLWARQESRSALEQARRSIPKERKQIEAMRSTMGEEGAKRSMAALDAAAAQIEEMAATIEKLPAPTAAEQKLLDANRDRIEQAMGGRGERRAPGEDAPGF